MSFDGEEYTMNLKYYMFDYYDWNKNDTMLIGFVSASDMYKLCRCGSAQFYENWGLYETTITWKDNEYSRQWALNKEKLKLILEENMF